MAQQSTHRTAFLLPQPKYCHATNRLARVGSASPVELQVGDGRVTQALLRWRDRFTPERGEARITVTADPLAVERAQGYELKVNPDHIQVIGGSAEGCFWGIQTLAQLSDFRAGLVHGCIIEDHPDYAARGILHDITRGKVPSLATLKTLIDRAASLKLNQVQLNIEHAFVFTFDREICDPDDGLTAEDARELDAYARERFVDLVPALSTLGHMGRILSMPRYRHLAEVEADKTWEHMNWLERMQGLTLDVTNPESHRLVERMWTDVLDAFASPVVNICGDEPWDLGKGKNAGRFSGDELGQAYLDRIRATRRICADRGRHCQFWSDVATNYPHLLTGLDDAILLHWGYDQRADYEGTAKFVQAGLETYVCPGTSGWKRIINAMDLAERNIAAFAEAGRRHAATGIITTDWGDQGHFNQLACAWHGFALGAAMGWSVDHPTGTLFDRSFVYAVLGSDDADGWAAMRAISDIGGGCETWRMLWMPIGGLVDDPTLPRPIEVVEADQAARTALDYCTQNLQAASDARPEWRELALACRFQKLLIEKIALIRSRGPEDRRHHMPPETLPDPADWADRLRQAAADFGSCWQDRNKPSGLGDILHALEQAADDVEPVQ